MIHRRRIRNNTVTRDAPVRRLHTDHAAMARRLAHRVTGIGADRKGNNTRSDHRRRTARRTAGHTSTIPGIIGIARKARLIGTAHRQLIHRTLGNAHGTGLLQLRPYFRIIDRNIIAQNTGPRRRTDPFRIHIILERNRNPAHQALLRQMFQLLLWINERNDIVQLLLQLLRLRISLIDPGLSAFPVPYHLCNRHYFTTFGRTKCPSIFLSTLASASSCEITFVTTSSRRNAVGSSKG